MGRLASKAARFFARKKRGFPSSPVKQALPGDGTSITLLSSGEPGSIGVGSPDQFGSSDEPPLHRS